MKTQKQKRTSGFTLVELIATISIAAFVLLGIGLVLADSHKGWRHMWERENEGIVPDAYVARKTFDRLVRQATIRRQLIDGDAYAVIGNVSLTVYHYENPVTSVELDKYATFRVAGSRLVADLGDLKAGTWEPEGSPATVVLAEDVEAVEFTVQGAAIRMELTLKTTRQTMTVTSCAYRYNGHNES
jgi:type II secretory pathway component PulJ